jgi:Icc protein
MQPILSFVHLTDTHLGPTRDFEYQGVRPADYLARLVALINDFPHPPDFVLHTGDVSQDRSAESFAIAAEILGDLRVPLVTVCGNHDDRALLRRCLHAPPDPGGDPGAPLTYTFTVNGERFLVLDSSSDAVPPPQGLVDDAQLGRVRQEATPDGPPLTVLVHHPLFPMASPWLNENMPIANGDSLHAALIPARDRLRGVFLGHLHRSSQVLRDGITYTCAASAAYQYSWLPWDSRPQVDPYFSPGYNLVHYLPEQVVVYQHAFERP